MNKFKGTKKKKKYVTMDEVLKNTYVHLVLMDDGSLWAHTHGMERYELQNISMRAENESYTTFCHHFLMELALDMINGEKYKLNWGHIQDDITTGDVLHGFYLMPSDDIDDNTGKQNIEAVYYSRRYIITMRNCNITENLGVLTKKTKSGMRYTSNGI